MIELIIVNAENKAEAPKATYNEYVDKSGSTSKVWVL